MSAYAYSSDSYDHELEQTRHEDLLLRIFTASAPHTGDDFFRALTLATATFCNVKVAFVAELLLDLELTRVVAMSVDGQAREPFETSLPHTPCEEVVAKGSATYPESVARRFPESLVLNELQAEVYAATLLRSGSGDPIGLFGIVHDVPVKDPAPLLSLVEDLAPRVAAELEHRQRESALRRNETRFRLLAEHSKDIMFYYRLLPSPRFEYISPAVTEIFGYPPEAFQANPEIAIQMLQEEYRLQLIKAMSTGSEEPIVARLLRPDGELRWIEYRNFPFRDSEERLVAVGGTIRDTTTRVEAEEALRLSEQYKRALLDAVPDTLFRLTEDGVILDFVPGEGIRDVLSPASGQSVLGRSLRDVLPAFAAPVRRLTDTSLRSGRLQSLELEVTTSGDSNFYEARCQPFGSKEVLLILRDFTAIKWHQGEEERRRIRDELDLKVEQHIRTNPYGLTYRELAVLHLIADGDADKQIAESLGISIYTVNKHVGNILGKMGAASRTEAGVRAIREGLLG